jgi:hypothetical protein
VKEKYMADKAPHRDKRTKYGRQNTKQGQKDNIWPKKHHTGTKGQTMADKTPHRDKRNNIIDTSSFANSAGIISVIQNTGNNVIIQNSTVVNVVITP